MASNSSAAAAPALSSSSSQPQQQYLNDLEKCGIATANNLRELLTTCPDPVEGIRQFQQMNSIQLPSLSPVMKLLDLHAIRRTEYHETLINELTDRTVQKLRALGEKQTPENVNKLEQHLERCFRLYRVPRIRPIVLETLTQLPKVADRYLKLIICDKELYDQCTVSVRQQIWVKNESLFLESVEPVLDAYIQEKAKQLLCVGTGASGGSETATAATIERDKLMPPFFASDSAKARRQKRQIQELISMIGQREQLYCRILDVLRERFLASENPHYCSLRFDLLMAAHDANLDFLARVDPCHDLAWCLDACFKHLRTKHLDAQQLAKLKTLLDIGGGGTAKNKGQKAESQQQQQQTNTALIPDMAMIAGCPHILHLISSFAIKMLRDNAANPSSHLPREMTSLHVLVKLLQMGLHAKELLNGQMSPAQLMDQELFTIFLAAFTSMLVQDVIRIELAQASDQQIVQQFAMQGDAEIGHRHPSVDRFLREQPVCALLWLHHLVLVGADLCPLSASKRRAFETTNALRYVEPLLWMANKLATNELWIQLLVHKLFQCPAAFANEQLCTLFVRRLFLSNLHKKPHIKFHLLRLCFHHRQLMPAQLLVAAVDYMQRSAEAEAKDEAEADGTDEAAAVAHPIVGNFSAEFDKYREPLLEQRKKAVEELRQKGLEEVSPIPELEEPEEGELLDDDDDDED